MGAVDTMEQFFELLNSGNREGAVALMDERAELRVHIAGNARTLKGLREVGGWFLRAEPGFRMIPGDVRDMGNTYQANLLVIRPGAPTQQLDASFRVEAGKVHLEEGLWPAAPELERLGHEVVRDGNVFAFGGGQAILVDGDALVGGSDARKDGYAAGI